MKNNGQIAGITDNVDGGRTVTHTYDSLHRLKTSVTNGSTPHPQWGLSWTYDRYGNRTQQSVTAGSGPSNTVTVSTSTNRITGMGAYTFYYDSNGNLTQDDLYKYKYDAENRMVEIKLLNDTLVSTYAFDGHSLRVIKVVGAARTWHIYAGTEIVAEYDDASSATYSAGTNSGSAPSDSVSTVLYQHSDHLTSRLTTENSGQLSNEQAHYPYGESWYAQGGADGSVLKKYTSYMKDAEASTGKLNYAVFREHSGRIGRFHMADPKRGRFRNPQRLNRYAYVRNSPINRTDRRGLADDPVYGAPDWMYEMDGGIMPSQYSGYYFNNRPAGYASDPNYQDAPWATGASWWADPSDLACAWWSVNAGPCPAGEDGHEPENPSWLADRRDCEGELRTCMGRAVDKFLDCAGPAGRTATTFLLACATACIVTGPGWVECAVGCFDIAGLYATGYGIGCTAALVWRTTDCITDYPACKARN